MAVKWACAMQQYLLMNPGTKLQAMDRLLCATWAVVVMTPARRARPRSAPHGSSALDHFVNGSSNGCGQSSAIGGAVDEAGIVGTGIVSKRRRSFSGRVLPCENYKTIVMQEDTDRNTAQERLGLNPQTICNRTHVPESHTNTQPGSTAKALLYKNFIYATLSNTYGQQAIVA